MQKAKRADAQPNEGMKLETPSELPLESRFVPTGSGLQGGQGHGVGAGGGNRRDRAMEDHREKPEDRVLASKRIAGRWPLAGLSESIHRGGFCNVGQEFEHGRGASRQPMTERQTSEQPTNQRPKFLVVFNGE